MNCSQPFSVLEDPAVHNVLIAIFNFYGPAIPLLFLSLSIFSLFSNLIIVIVLSRREMRSFGINNMMVVMAICDLFCTVSMLNTSVSEDISKGASIFRVLVPIVSFYLVVALHSLSIYLAVGMAFCRIMSLRTDGRTSRLWQSSTYALRVSFILLLFTFSVAIPYGLLLRTSKISDGLYTLDIVLDNGCILLKTVFLLNGVVLKLIPCTSMIYFSVIILRSINENKERNMKIRQSRAYSKQMDRSSDLILSILVIFLITELPQVGFSLFSGVFTKDYCLYAGPNIGKIFDFLTLLNSASSIVIYCLLSSQFRAIFLRVVMRKKMPIIAIQRRNTSLLLNMSDNTEKVLECQKDLILLGGPIETHPITRFLYTFHSYYSLIHLHLLVFFTTLDFFANILIVIVLSQRELRSSGINTTMIMIAICNFISVVLTLTQNVFQSINGFQKSFGQAFYGWIELYLNIFLPSTANYLVVQMAFCRVMSLFSHNSIKWNGTKFALRLAFSIWTLVGVTSASIIPMTSVEWDESGERYMTTISEGYLENECIILRATFFFIGVTFELIPCIFIVIFFGLILWKMKKSRSSRARALGSRNVQSMDRSSRPLQIILIMFLVAKTPDSFLNIFSSFFLLDYLIIIGPLTSDFMDILLIINDSASFIIYCSMSSAFRNVFLSLFVPFALRRKFEKTRGLQITVVASTRKML